MSWTKRQFIESAFEEIGLASYVFDLQPEQLDMALRRLDSMMATWNAKGVRLGYPIPNTPNDSNLDEITGVQDSANQAIILNLAVNLAPAFGKQVSPDTKMLAKQSFRTLLSLSTKPIEMQMPSTMPSGAGNKPNQYDNNTFLNAPEDYLLAGDDSKLDFE